MKLEAVRQMGLRVGAVIQVAFPLECCSPTFTVTRLNWEDVTLANARGDVCSIPLVHMTRYLARGSCVVVTHAA